jgi:hypothetical protein
MIQLGDSREKFEIRRFHRLSALVSTIMNRLHMRYWTELLIQCYLNSRPSTESPLNPEVTAYR